MNLLDARCVWSFHQFWFDLLQMMLYIISRISYASMGCDVTYFSDFKCLNVSCLWWENEYDRTNLLSKTVFQSIQDCSWRNMKILYCSMLTVMGNSYNYINIKCTIRFVVLGLRFYNFKLFDFIHSHRLNCKLPM